VSIKQTTIKKVIEVVNATVKAGIRDEAFFLSGPCGIGKTTVAHIVGKDNNLPVVEFRPAEMEAVELVGAPWLDEKTESVRYFRPDVIPTDPCVFLVDELTLATSDMYSVMIKLIRERELGGVKLHPDTVVIATGNRVSDRAGVNRISSALRESFVMFDVTSNASNWLQYYATVENYNESVWHYISANEEMLNDWDGKEEHNQPCPRNWVKVGKFANVLSGSNLRAMLNGVIGKTATSKFMAFVKELASVVSVDDVLDGKKKVPTNALDLQSFGKRIGEWLVMEYDNTGTVRNTEQQETHDKVCGILLGLGASVVVPVLSQIKRVKGSNVIIKASPALTSMTLDNLDSINAATAE
tara:strand:- start:509 stop:1573 length:1065 start_codon:yes stop_codon:yes gene_type:complete